MPEAGAGWTRPSLADDLGHGAIRPVVIHPAPILSQRCEPVGYLPEAQIRALAADLLATMYAAGGRGLAAPQIGVAQRVFVMDPGWKDGRPAPLVLLDPEILSRGDTLSDAVEECLSIPGQPVTIARPDEIELLWYDLSGCRHQRVMTGAEARIAQHEADHLDGRLIVDVPV